MQLMAKQSSMALRIKVLRSTPLQPIATKMRELTQQAEEFWVATAFLSRETVEDIIASGLAAHTRIQLLTGTFGHQTRRLTFRRLLRLAQLGHHKGRLEARIWDCGRHQNLHAKLYIWRVDARAIAWLGSANMTVGGLQEEGELVFELRGMWDSPTFRTLRAAFEHEWRRSDPLDAAFVSRYQEAARPAPDMRLTRRGRGTAIEPRMPTFLLTWNPQKSPWDDLDEDVARTKRTGRLKSSWSCGVTKAIPKGSRLFLVRLGVQPKGLVGSACARSSPYYDRHWDPDKDRRGQQALYVDIDFDVLIERPIISLDELRDKWPTFNWSPQASGVRIPDDIASQLERAWGLRTRSSTRVDGPHRIGSRSAGPRA
jgi:HKD family nuclease